MSQNIIHYRSLIEYLNRKNKEQQMNVKMLKQLEEYEKNNQVTHLSEVEELKQSLEPLQKCVELSLRGKLLLSVVSILQKQGADAWLSLEQEENNRLDVTSPYDVQFDASINVNVPVNELVSVCLGCNSKSQFWLGYMRRSNGKNIKAVEEIVQNEAKAQLKEIDDIDAPWFAWKWLDVKIQDLDANHLVNAENMPSN